jgi:predicted ATPase
MEMTCDNWKAAHEHIEAGLALYSKEAHGHHALLYGGHDPAVCGYASDTQILQVFGQLDRALVQLEKGLALARELAHPPSLIHALGFGAEAVFERRDPLLTAKLVAEWLPLVSDYSSTVGVTVAMMLRGWAMVMLGERAAGLAELRDGLDRWRATGSKFRAPYRLGIPVAALIEVGEVGEAMAVLGDAFQLMESTGDRWYEAELHRFKGLLLLASSGDRQAEAEACFQHAIGVAHSQGKRLFELRAALALSRQHCDPEQRKRRCALLASLYGAFTEGLDTADLKEAKALLDELR